MPDPIEKAENVIIDVEEKQKVKNYIDSLDEIRGALVITFNSDNTFNSWMSRTDCDPGVIIGTLERVKLNFIEDFIEERKRS